MKLLAYAIRDKQVDAFLPVFFVRAKGEAMRHFIDAVADPKSRFGSHPGDYDLYQLFEFDDVSGMVVAPTGVDEFQRVMTGLDAASVSAASK